MSQARQESDAPLGSFEEQVMLAVARTGREAYGVSVRREIERQTGRRITIGAVYATLDRLEAKALVSSIRENVDGLSRRSFAITSSGAAALLRTRAMRERLWDGLDAARLAASLG